MKIVDGVSYNTSKHNNKNRICNANKYNHTETWSMQRLSQWTQCLYLAWDENPNENVSYSQYTWHVCTWVFLNCQACALLTIIPLFHGIVNILQAVKQHY